MVFDEVDDCGECRARLAGRSASCKGDGEADRVMAWQISHSRRRKPLREVRSQETQLDAVKRESEA